MLGLVILNVLASIAHFAHNIIYFDIYPEPEWISSPWVVDALWFVMTPFLLIGYALHRRKAPGMALLAVVVYCGMSLLVFGHYLYASPFQLSLEVNFFILFEGLAAASLLAYYCRYFVGQRRAG